MDFLSLFAIFREKVSFPRKAKPLDDHIQESLAWHHKRDPKENRETSPPEDERINVHCLWVVEFYLPSQLDKLLLGIRDLGWTDSATIFDRQGPEQWVQQAMVSPNSGGWSNLGVVTRPGDQRFLGGSRHAPLPEVVDFARASIQSFSAGIVAVVLQFVLNDEAAGRLEAELRLDRKTHAERNPRGWSFIDPQNQKREACRTSRSLLKSACCSWFRNNLPGFFAEQSSDGQFPTADFLTFQEAVPFERLAGGSHMNYMWVLRMESEIDAWASKESPGIRLGYDRYDSDGSFNLTLAAREGDLFPQASDSYLNSLGGRCREGYTNWLSSYDRTLVVWALAALQTTLEKHLAKIRNVVAGINFDNVKEASHQLQAAQRNLLRLSNDIISAVPQVERLCNNPRLFHFKVDECPPLSETFAQVPHLFESVRQNLKERSVQLRESERELRDAILAQGSVLATASQERATNTVVRLQWGMAFLTVALVALTALLLARAV